MRTVAIAIVCVVIACGARAAGACSDAGFREFDFWIGEWEVRDPAGELVGSSRIRAILDGCVMHEHWEGKGSSAGFDGESFNTYDPSTKGWYQNWVDNTGRNTRLEGGFGGGAMVMTSGVLARPRGPQLSRVTWTRTDADHVRQLVERSTDFGRTWSVAFDARYARRK